MQKSRSSASWVGEVLGICMGLHGEGDVIACHAASQAVYRRGLDVWLAHHISQRLRVNPYIFQV